MAIDIYDDYVVLRMRMNGADGGTTFVDDKGATVTVGGNAHIENTQSKFGGTAAQFDGSGDYLSIADWSAFTFGAQDFTIECWVYATAGPGLHSGAYFGIIVAKDASGQREFWMRMTGSSSAAYTGIGFVITPDGTNFVGPSATYSFSLNTWYHLAFVRSGDTLIGFVNGTIVSTASANSYTIANTTAALKIGEDGLGLGDFAGYIDDLRITKGVARYTTNFTPPTEEMGMGYSKIVSGVVRGVDGELCQRALRLHRRSDGLLIDEGFSNPSTGAYTLRALDTQKHYVIAHDTEDIGTYFAFDGTHGSTAITDTNGNTFTNTGGLTLSTTDKKFGTSSLYGDGSTAGYVVSAPSSDFTFYDKDFTIELWARAATDCVSCYMLSNNASFVGYTTWILEPTHALNPGKWCFYAFGVASAGSPLISTSDSLVDTWTHIAVTRSGSTFRLFINGTVEDTYTTSLPIDTGLPQPLYMNGSAARYKGYIDDLRITKGYARYTANFDVPTAPHFTEVSGDQYRNQVVLGMHMEGSDGGTTFTDITGKTVTVAGNTHTEVDQYKFGSTSAYFDGTGDYLTTPASGDFNLGGFGDFCIEAWIYPTAISATTWNTIVSRNVTDAVGAWRFIIGDSGTTKLAFGYVDTASTWRSVNSTTLVSLNTWTHVAVTRVLGVLYLYVNGVYQASNASNYNAGTNTQQVSIGRIENTSTWYFTGYIDDLRITKGVARYTANFTAPTAAFPDTLPYYGQQNAQILDYITPG